MKSQDPLGFQNIDQGLVEKAVETASDGGASRPDITSRLHVCHNGSAIGLGSDSDIPDPFSLLRASDKRLAQEAWHTE